MVLASISVDRIAEQSYNQPEWGLEDVSRIIIMDERDTLRAFR